MPKIRQFVVEMALGGRSSDIWNGIPLSAITSSVHAASSAGIELLATGVNLFPESPSSGGAKSANVIRDSHLDVRFG